MGEKPNLSPEEIKKITRSIERTYMKIMGTTLGLEDARQDVLLWVLEGRKGKLKYAIIDHIRKRFGDIRRKSYESAHNILQPSSIHSEESGEELYGVTSPRRAEDLSECYKMMSGVGNGVDRASFLLYHYWGFSLGEIADLFDVTEQRILQRVRNFEKFMERRTRRMR